MTRTWNPLFPSIERRLATPSLTPSSRRSRTNRFQRNTQYWIERLAPRAESIIDLTLDRLVDLNILEHHDGEFWTLSHTVGRRDLVSGNGEGTAVEFVTSRIRNVIFNNEIPFPRDVVIVCLLNTCDVLRFIFQIDDELEKRVEAICRLDLIGRAIAEAVSHNLAGPLLQRSALTKKIPTVSLGKLLFNPHIRDGNIPALFADLAQEYGPVFQISPPFRETMIFLAGTETNQWVQRRGRMYLRARDYFVDFEKVYGSSGVLPSLDGADHFRLRKSLSAAYSRKRLAGQMEEFYEYARNHMAEWKVGESYPATGMSRRMINAQISPFMIGVETQDIIDDLLEFKERAPQRSHHEDAAQVHAENSRYEAPDETH